MPGVTSVAGSMSTSVVASGSTLSSPRSFIRRPTPFGATAPSGIDWPAMTTTRSKAVRPSQRRTSRAWIGLKTAAAESGMVAANPPPGCSATGVPLSVRSAPAGPTPVVWPVTEAVAACEKAPCAGVSIVTVKGTHAGQGAPPQSTSVSPPLRTPSAQVGAWQRPPVQTPLSQSVPPPQPSPAGQPAQAGPPQSTPVSVPSRTPLVHDTGWQTPAVQMPL